MNFGFNFKYGFGGKKPGGGGGGGGGGGSPSITDYFAWFDARDLGLSDGANIDTFKSVGEARTLNDFGTGAKCVYNTGVQNGLPAVRGTDNDLLDNGGGSGIAATEYFGVGDFTLFFAIRHNDTASTAGSVCFGHSSTATPRRMGMRGHYGSNATLQVRAQSLYQGGNVAGTPAIWCISNDASNGSTGVTYYKNGSSVGTDPGQGADPSADAAGVFGFGNMVTADLYDKRFFEGGVYQRLLSPVEIATTFSDINSTWAIY